MADLRIGFTGASGTGKSTLASIVAKHYDLEINPVGSRSVAASMGYSSPYDVDKDGKRAEFQRRLLHDKIAWEAVHESFVVDRLPIDNLLYTVIHDVAAVDQAMLDHVRRGLARYTHIIYCPVKSFCFLDDDPARVQSAVYHDVYDAMLVGLIERYVENKNRRVLMLNINGLINRQEMVAAHIDGRL